MKWLDSLKAVDRNKVGAIVFFVLGFLFSGLACMLAVYRELAQEKKSGVLEREDLKNYVKWSGIGAIVQAFILMVL